ncbi:hypothetical protein [Streptomyces sp. gb14]|uniref:hypothetical protein n=1 Tax=Streptomyces sp. gb14 TaxID=1827753 RepID=UPI000BEF218B|nr:hypothetical protein [Streptomyces sp. gb14]
MLGVEETMHIKAAKRVSVLFVTGVLAATLSPAALAVPRDDGPVGVSVATAVSMDGPAVANANVNAIEDNADQQPTSLEDPLLTCTAGASLSGDVWTFRGCRVGEDYQSPYSGPALVRIKNAEPLPYSYLSCALVRHTNIWSPTEGNFCTIL